MQLPLSAIIIQLSPAGNSLLLESVAFGHNELAAILASHFPFLLSMKNILGDTILHVAAKKGSLPIVQLVIAAFEEHFPDSTACEVCSLVRMKNEYGNTALHEAVINTKDDVVEFLVNKDVEMWYRKNDEDKSPLFLAVESGDLGIVKKLLNASVSDTVNNKLQGHSPVHAAIVKNRLDMLKEVFDRRPELFQLKGVKETNPLHLAVQVGHLDIVKFLLSESLCCPFEYDEDGQLPIHTICAARHLSIATTIKLMSELFQQWPDPSEQLDKQGRNILHIAAMNGRDIVVRRILEAPELGMLINQRDKDGNTPIHLATNWYPLVVYYLSSDARTKMNIQNKHSMTAMDFVKDHLLGFNPPLRKEYTRVILCAAGARGSENLLISKAERWNSENRREPPSKEFLKDKVNSRLLMETLVATITFAAGFVDPGGNKNSSNSGSSFVYGIFVISNAIAMYTSVLVIIILLYSQGSLGRDSYAAVRALNVLMSLSLITMSNGFLAGTCVTLDRYRSLANVMFFIGFLVVFSIISLTVIVYLPYTITLPVFRLLSYIKFLMEVDFTWSNQPPTKEFLAEFAL